MDGLAGRTPTRDTNVVLLLTLFLMLLAFFAVLSSLAAPQRARSAAVSASLSQTFRGAQDPLSHEGAAAREALFKSLSAAVERFAALGRIAPRVAGERVQIVMPSGGLFMPGESRLKPEAARFIAEIGGALAAAPADWRYEPEVVIGGRPDGPAAPDLPPDLSLSRAYRLGAALVEAGAPRSLAVGVSSDGEPDVAFTVRVVEVTP